jgi:predicted alpha-1,2-mannosidase
MKRIASLILVAGLSSIALAAPAPQSVKQPVDYVSPNIGGIGQLLTPTIPYVQYPYGMARIAPVTTPGIQDRYLADKIYGFPAGPATLMVSTGAAAARPAAYASDFDHDFETTTPYYYAADLLTWNIKSEFTATEHCAYYRFTFPASSSAHFAISAMRRAELTVVNDHTVQGSEGIRGPIGEIGATAKETREYFYAEFSRPFASTQTWQQGDLSSASTQSGNNVGFVSTSSTTPGQQIEVRVGISYISADQARQNLQHEIPAWSFDHVKAATRAVWNQALGAVATVGGTENQRTIFYTALYRSLGRMTDITEYGRYFSGYDHAVHNSDGHDFYSDDGLWDTFRCLHPLQTLLDARRQEDMATTYIRMYEQSGWMPAFPAVAGDQAVMIGHHADEFILDLYEKGYRDFDVEKAYEGMRKNSTDATLLPWRRGPLTSLDKVYYDKGFFPALAWGEKETVPEVTSEKRQAVSVTLETTYDDWAVAQLAKALGKQDDAEHFTKLAYNYRNVWNPAIGFMAPKSADGNWVANFNPKLSGGQGGRDYTTEVDSWQYTFNLQFDPAGLIQLMGGHDGFNAKLDQLFVEQYGESKFQFLGQFPDATGLVGLYSQGNEPDFHIPYLYDFSGQPWKTQRRVRQLMDVWYTADTHGIPGDDDGGATSSWYVLSAMGFFPVCPGSPIYELGSPIFEKTTLRMGNGKLFTITAHHVSAQNKYIQSALLNGKPLNTAWFHHADIANGGTLVLEMGPKPNYKWGSAPADAPPSLSNPNPGQ